MLIEFSVENFRSIKDKLTLSLLSSKSKKIRNNTFSINLNHKKPISLLSSAAIYGQNAAGKTNILHAIGTMKYIVTTPRERMFQLPYTPFLFSKHSLNTPTTFNIIIAIDDIEHEYGFVINKEKVLAEWLHVGSKTLFTRELENLEAQDYVYKFPNANLVGQKKTWENSTRPDALFLSTAVGLNNTQLKPIYDWFSSTLEIMGGYINTSKSVPWCETESGKQEIIQFLKAADFFITDIETKERPPLPNPPPQIKQMLEKFGDQLGNIKSYDIQFKHPTDYDDGVFLNLINESTGTQKMYSLAGYWLEALQKNKVIFYYELNNSLHPLLVRFLIDQFNSKTKSSNAQLIFTTHDTSILDQSILDRDQIWFCERDSEQASTLKSLVEYKHRSDILSIEKAYLKGRYGAIPIIDEE
jgi:AAA15 family ATPase/GTPase